VPKFGGAYFFVTPAMGARRHSDHKGVTSFDVTTLGSDNDIKEICYETVFGANTTVDMGN